MKLKIFFSFALLLQISISFCQNSLRAYVDERTELLSVIFRLAEAKEYMNNNIPSYSKDIDVYFAPFKEHETVKFAKEIRSKYGVAYDADMSFAIDIEISDSVRLRKNLSKLCIDNRWNHESMTKFLQLVNKFYFETKFKVFFSNHSVLYKVAENRFSEITKDVDFNWFEKFYGEKPNGSFNLILSISNGSGNYGPSAIFNDGKKDIYAIIGSCKADSLGMPVYSKNTVSTIVHEYNHSFCNPLIEANYSEMKKKSEKIFKLVRKKLASQAYGNSKTMDYEILVRACVIKYNQSKNDNKNVSKNLISTEMACGFLWIDKLYNLLDVYEKNRDKYPTLKEFMPEIVKLVNSLTAKQILAEYNAKCPRLVSISIPNNSKDVNPNITKITLTFDRPMAIGCNGISYGEKGKDYFPDFIMPNDAKWNEETKKEWTFFVILKENRTYSLSFPFQFFRDENGFYLDTTYNLDFTTGDKK